MSAQVYTEVVKSGWREPYGMRLYVTEEEWKRNGPLGTGHLSRRLTPPSQDINASDGAKKLADEHDIDLTTIEGTGPDGRIYVRDLEALIPNDE